jgi:N,N'-diacetyllegionaminate synthase
MNLNKVFIIAEVGVNHNGKIQLAKKLIAIAKKAGADAVKFQTFKAKNLAFKNTPKVKYQITNSSKKETHYEMLKKLELSKKNHKELINYCKKLKIEFLSTPYDVDSAKFLLKCGVKKFKTASADVIDFFLHEYLAKEAKEVIISF